MDRVLSAYEFATEVAARAGLSDTPQRQDPRATNTRNVWPWSGLVPWLEDELHARSLNVQARLLTDDDNPLDPYNNSMVLPLAEFIEHPLAHELVHNGETLQVCVVEGGVDGGRPGRVLRGRCQLGTGSRIADHQGHSWFPGRHSA